jgi:hypothetical protein
MKKLLLATALIGTAISLGGCFITTGGGTSPVVIGTGNATVDAIINGTLDKCKYQPEEQFVFNILATFVPGAQPINVLVNRLITDICTAETSKSARFGGVPMVRGVPVRGKFVR